MQVSDAALDELIALYKKEFDEVLTQDEARTLAQRLMSLYGLLVKKLPAEHEAPDTTPLPEENPRRPCGFLA